MNLVATLAQRAHDHPQAIALCDRFEGRDRSVTFAELYQRVCGVSAQLRQAGLQPGQTVFLLHPIRIEFYIHLLAAMHCGVVVMLADPSAGAKFIQQCCQRKQPDAFIGIRKAHLLRWWIAPLRRIKQAFHDQGWMPFSQRLEEATSDIRYHDCQNEHPALITFTSGSTGQPKAAVRTHGFLLAQHRALAKALDLREGEIDLVTLPVFCLANLASGLTSVLADMPFAAPAKADAASILRQCRHYQVDRCAASPAFFEALLRGEIHPFRSLYTGGAPVHPDLLERLSMALPEASITAVYGSTEAEPIAECRNPDLDALAAAAFAGKGLCAGKVVDEITCRIIRDQWGTAIAPMTHQEFSAMQCATVTTGEIVVCGDHVLPGYLDGCGDHETKFRVDGTIWHRTGDAGCFDASGTLWLMGRCSAKLTRADGSSLYPFAIECIIRRLWPRCRAAIVAHHNRNLLVVEKNTAPDIAELKDFVNSQMLDDVRMVESIPLDKRHNAKIDYPALRALLDLRR